MAGGWGSAKNSIRIGVFWDGVEYNSDKSQARITDPRIAIDRGVNIKSLTEPDIVIPVVSATPNGGSGRVARTRDSDA